MEKKKCILVVDDNPLEIKILTRALESRGYSVLTAATGKEAVEIAKHNNPDLIILDYIMPDGDGLFVITKLKSSLETFTIPVIFLTAYSSKEVRKQVFQLSAVDIIGKPYDKKELLEKVEKILEKEKASG